ncbi:MAG: cold shock domain-containing protein [Deltaproteobacteria bacterium]|nr:cold shock domain-containing protein [Deltaproteobacteria bacterium]
MKGTIKRLFKNRGFGFIKAEDGREIFFHMTGVDGVEFDSLTEGQAVEFDIEKNQKGSRNKGPRAINVKLAD